ncbi:hypothetical protein M8C21_006290 [Ambrosia artemisiifolia]|uniref:Uncharacterized protein n=1 Tax=Ambrosia artemisiifolia TaxID=4212 RepID=A0AAD5G1M9_AMBAR|nr:hypothetical protein M8C21_006290 [Ambrosia artemisiifolia]
MKKWKCDSKGHDEQGCFDYAVRNFIVLLHRGSISEQYGTATVN